LHRLRILPPFLCPLFHRIFWRTRFCKPSFFRTTSLRYVRLWGWNTSDSSRTSLVSGCSSRREIWIM
jgi:hypothetical protein